MPAPDLFLFVSHVSEDRAAALQIVAELEKRGAKQVGEGGRPDRH